MVLQYQSLETPIDVINLIFWIIVVLVNYTIMAIIILKVIKKDIEKFNRENLITWALFFLLLGITNTMNVLWRFFIMESEAATNIDMISILFSLCAWFIKIINVEHGINKSNIYKGYYFTILISAIITGFILMNPLFIREFGILQVIAAIMVFVGASLLPGIYVYLAIKSTGRARSNSIWVAIGALLILIAMNFQPQNIIPFIQTWPNFALLIIISKIIGPIFLIFGCLMIFKVILTSIKD